MRASSLWLIVLLVNAAACTASDRTFEKRVAADARGEVIISNVAGRVEVSGWERSEVDVQARLGSGVDRVDVRADGGRTVVRVVVPRSSRRSDAVLEVRIPQGSSLDLTTVSADVSSEGVLGEQRLKTVSGDVRSTFAGADIEVKTVSGDVSLRGRNDPADLRVSTVSGNVRLDRGAGELDVTTVSGDLQLDLAPLESMRVRTTSGDLSLEGRLARGATLDAETISGELDIRAPAAAGFEYEVVTFSGDIENCFGEPVVRTSRYGPGSRLRGVRGEGGGQVRLKTMSGDVDLCDR